MVLDIRVAAVQRSKAMIGVLKRLIWVILAIPLFVLSILTLIPLLAALFVITGNDDIEDAWWFWPLMDWWLS